jgi:hypothetical protein
VKATLHIRGKFIMCADSTPNAPKAEEELKPKFDWGDALIDAVIMSGVTGITAYVGTGSELGAIKAGLLAFFTFLAIKRGLIEKQKATA